MDFKKELRRCIGHFVDLDLPSGTLWARCNYGVTKETDYGGLFTQEEALKITSRLPTVEQVKELFDYTHLTNEIIDNVKVVKFTSLKDENNFIILPKSGYKSPHTLNRITLSVGDFSLFWTKECDYNSQLGWYGHVQSNRVCSIYTTYKFSIREVI